MSEAANLATGLAEQYRAVREQTEALCRPLPVEDYGVQPMADASPPKWHLAHTTWFFETFVLAPFARGHQPFHPDFEYLFNSYYNGVGQPFPRDRRGTLSRPIVDDVYEYRRHVDRAMTTLLDRQVPEINARTTLGLNHEQQHQELILTDLKYNLGGNPLLPRYRDDLRATPGKLRPLRWLERSGGLVEVGMQVDGEAFKFDNETPRHKAWLAPFRLADRLVTNAEYRNFMDDGGYRTSALWLSEGWATVQEHGWRAPLYWRQRDSEWWEYRLSGAAEVQPEAPVVHVSFYEADAYARWAGARLPTEFEWESAASSDSANSNLDCNLVESEFLHPTPVGSDGNATQLIGDVWEWTASAYLPYAGYAPLPGTLGEYNGKFMSNQMVLRGGSCATSESHIRSTYRNFFYPPDRWQFSGIRLAQDISL